MFKPKQITKTPSPVDDTPIVYESQPHQIVDEHLEDKLDSLSHENMQNIAIERINRVTQHITTNDAAKSNIENHHTANQGANNRGAPRNTSHNHSDKALHEFNGNKIEYLEATGFKTIELVKVANKTTDRPRYNVAILETMPLSIVFRSLGAQKTGEHPSGEQYFHFRGFDFKTIDNKWYNNTAQHGRINAISLCKDLIAIKENINSYENDKSLFISSCKHLTQLQWDLQNNDSIEEPGIPVHLASQFPQKNNPANINNVNDINNSNTLNTENNRQHTINPHHQDTTPASSHQGNTDNIRKNEPHDANSLNDVQNNVPNTDQDNSDKKGKPINWTLLIEQLNTIPLVSVMEFLGASPNEDNHRGKWKIHRTGHNVQVTGNKWMNWNTSEGGYGGITLMMDFISFSENINLKDPHGKSYARKLAIKELMKEFGSDFDSASIEAGSPTYRIPFAMPQIIDSRVNDVRVYLHEKRGLPLWIINKQIETGNLFAGCPYDWKIDGKKNINLKRPEKIDKENIWAVFLAINGNAAEMRAIERSDHYAKILAAGSDKSTGGFLIKDEKDCREKTVTILEAAIDSLSYHAFYPGRVAMSGMGVNFNLAVTSAIQALDSNYNFQLAFDNDKAGNEGTVNFKNHLIEEIGEEEYKEHIDNKRIHYFDLGIKVLQETVKNNEIYYFDTMNHEKGQEAAKMFREQLFKDLPEESIKEWEKKGLIKYINICPVFQLMRDPKLEARQAFDLLDSNKSYYLRFKIEDDEDNILMQKRMSFEAAFKDISQHKMQEWIDKGKIIFEKEVIAKDWNEFFIYKKNSPEFLASLREQEEKYAHYSNKEKSPQNIEEKKTKMSI